MEGRGSEVQDHPGLHAELVGRLGYMRHCVKEIKSNKTKVSLIREVPESHISLSVSMTICKKSRGNWTDIVPLKENKQLFLHGKVALVLADLNTLRFVLLY